MTPENVLFSLLRTQICHGSLDAEEKAALTPELLERVYALSKKHDLVHLAGYALKKQGLFQKDALSKQYDRQIMQAIYRYTQLSREYTLILQTLEAHRIPHLPLKGSVLREYYPQPWMRTSCDIDILVRKETLSDAVAALQQALQYSAGKQEIHDISLYSPEGVHLELHYDTIGEINEAGNCRDVLARVWEDASPASPESVRFNLSDPMFYFYHIAHMAKHFENGGCGIRPFLDLWILNHQIPHDPAARQALLTEGGLAKFAAAVETLSEVWFSGAQPDPLSRMLQDYLLEAGVYGNWKNFSAVGQAKAGSKKRYLLRRIFMPYWELKAYYPTLQRHKWLTPFCQVARWLRILFSGGMKRAKAEFKSSTDATQATAELLDQLGLS